MGSVTDADTREEGVKGNKMVGVRWKIILVIKSPYYTSYNTQGPVSSNRRASREEHLPLSLLKNPLMV